MQYNVLLIGGGGREHAIAWKLSQSPQVNICYINMQNFIIIINNIIYI